MFSKRNDLEVRSAGTSADALARVNARMLEWADVIFIMDDHQRRSLGDMFPAHPALERVVCLDIPDDFNFLDPQLMRLLQERVDAHLDD
ncbi:MAG: protein tyrosine phosphatase [Acidobacteria bacterium]|nr:protein tyrosine phosphatase [Acidobacteriota bacterium]MCA1650314.1 protein tyrosine phosphatase [Acidobacteriota bacterium]